MTMRIRVDRSLCAGHALCFLKAPELYQLDDEGFCVADGTIVQDHQEDDARAGAAFCPERAITLIED